MNIIAELFVESGIYFTIEVPDFSKKLNPYYEPTPKLHKFDEVSVSLTIDNASHLVMHDIIQVIVCPLYHFLKRSMAHKIPLPSSVTPGTLGSLYNRNYYDNYWKNNTGKSSAIIDYKQFWLWSAHNLMQSWMYNHNNKIYLEIGEAYSLLPQKNDKAFEEHMSQYKPLLFVEIPQNIAEEWLQKCEKIMHDIDEACELVREL